MRYTHKRIGYFIFVSLFFLSVSFSNDVYAQSNFLSSLKFFKTVLSDGPEHSNSEKHFLIPAPVCGNGRLEENEACDGVEGVKDGWRCSDECKLVRLGGSGNAAADDDEKFDGGKRPNIKVYSIKAPSIAADPYDLKEMPSEFPKISWPVLPEINSEIEVRTTEEFNSAAAKPFTRVRVAADLRGDGIISASDVEIVAAEGVRIDFLYVNYGIRRVHIKGGEYNELNIKAPVTFWPEHKVYPEQVVEDVLIEEVNVRSTAYYAFFGTAKRLAVLKSKFWSESATFTCESPEGVMGEDYIIAGNEFHSWGSLPNISISGASKVVFIDNFAISRNAFNPLNLKIDEPQAFNYVGRNKFVGTGVFLSGSKSWAEGNLFYHERGTLFTVNPKTAELTAVDNMVYSDIADDLVPDPHPEAWRISGNGFFGYQRPTGEEDPALPAAKSSNPDLEASSSTMSGVTMAEPRKRLRPFFIGPSLLDVRIPKMIDTIAESLGLNNFYAYEESYLTGLGVSLRWLYNHPYDGQGADPFAELVQPNKYDALVMTDAISVVDFEEETKVFAERFHQLALRGNRDIDLFLFATWVHKENHTFADWSDSLDREARSWERIRDYLAARNKQKNIYIIPGGYALRKLVEEADAGRVPGLLNGDELFEDDSVHLNALGNYFMALVQVAALYRGNPAGAAHITYTPWEEQNHPFPNPEMAEKMQAIAWEIVSGYPYSGVAATAQEQICGNGVKEIKEACDDGNVMDGDGCSSVCVLEEHLLANQQPAADDKNEKPKPALDDAGIRDGDKRDIETLYASPSGNDLKSLRTTGVGLSLSWNYDYIQQWMFVDAMKHSRNWGTRAQSGWQGWNTETGKEIKWRSDGYPVEIPAETSKGPQVVFTMMLYDHELAESTWPAGEYTVFFDGDGELAFGGDATLISQSEGKYIIAVQSRSYVELQIIRSNRNDPVRNVRVIMPGFENDYASNPFHPLFLERLGTVDAIKFTNLSAVNFNDKGSLRGRVAPDYFSQGTEKGVALEYIVQLANLTHKDAWLNLPHAAENKDIVTYAKYLRHNLNPSLKIYLEFSNEVWNDAFSQSAWLRERGCKNPDTFVPVPRGNGTDNGIRGCDDFAAGIRATAKRMAEVFAVFDRVFAGQSHRIVKVIGGLADWRDYNDLLWNNFNDPTLNPSRVRADAFAIAPYFGRSEDIGRIIQREGGDSLSVDTVLDFAASDLHTKVAGLIEYYGEWAKIHNLRLLAYEAGNNLTYTAGGPELAAIVENASRHPRMKELYLEYIDKWKQAGGELMMFNYVDLPGPGSTRGILEYQNQPLDQAYMYQAVMPVVDDENPPVVCGDGVTEAWERCDDGNRSDGDGCSQYCRIE